jgi:hypothetical protein
MPGQRDVDKVRLIEVEAVLEHRQQVKAAAVKRNISLRKRGRKNPADSEEPALGLRSGRPGSGSM